MKSPSRNAWFIWPVVLLTNAGAATWFFYPKLLTGDFAEITVESVVATGPGEVEIRYRGRISRGTWLDEGPGGGRDFASNSTPFGRPERLESSDGPTVLKIYTIRNDEGMLGSPAEVLQRISVKPGKTYRIRPNRPLALLHYTAHDGTEVEKSLRVGSSSVP